MNVMSDFGRVQSINNDRRDMNELFDQVSFAQVNEVLHATNVIIKRKAKVLIAYKYRLCCFKDTITNLSEKLTVENSFGDLEWYLTYLMISVTSLCPIKKLAYLKRLKPSFGLNEI